MGTIAAKTKAKQKPKNSFSQAKMAEAIHRIAEAHTTSNEQVMREMHQVRQEIQEMKATLDRLKVRQPSQRRRGGLFGRRRSIPVELEPPKPKPALPLEDLLPLLPQLGNVIPQLKNPKVAESVKVLSNPAAIAMIQQFLANGGLKGRTVTPVSRRERRIWG
ncbi:hypothetical protein NST37_02965 [Brevibacillus sp. FSL K6-6036]|uniref:hypothetical protein n=1 Tax=Brevibacillus sp. FSL K6-6036 TaxID=2954682 RepID=UPI0030D5D979